MHSYRIQFLLLAFSFFNWVPTSFAQDEKENPAPPTEKAEQKEEKKKVPAVKKIGETRYRLGELEFDAKTREIFVPATVNMKEGGPVEYVLVHESGKVHESIFTTKANPLSLQIAMKLLKYKSGNGDLFNIRLPEEERNAKTEGKKEDRGDSVQVLVSWAEKEAEPFAVNDAVLDGRELESMTEGGWIYTGSYVEQGSFMAAMEGSIVAVYLDAAAMFNMPRDGADDDERWGANGKIMKEVGEKATIILKIEKQP